MKRIFIIIISLIFSTIIFSQGTQEAKKLIYHERYNSAENMLHTILQAGTDNEEAWYLLTKTYLEQDKVKAIKDSLQKAPQTILNTPLMKAAYGHILMRENDVANVHQNFQDILKQTRYKNVAVLMEIAKAYIDTKNADANYAIELLNKAIKRDKKNPEIYVMIGDAYSKLSNGSDAYSAYQKALQLDADYARASYRLGKIFTSQNNPVYMQYFNDALAADSLYAPALYEIYYHYYFRDVTQAMAYLQKYIAASDYNTENEYRLTDMLFLQKDYEAAIRSGKQLIKKEGKNVSPRIYKLIANSYKNLNDNENALASMQKYFDRNTDTAYLAADYETMGDIYVALNNNTDSAAHFYIMAAAQNSKEADKFRLYKTIATLYSNAKNYEQQAVWLQKYYDGNVAATNVDLFNWGLAEYYATQYHLADSVFALYTGKYPDQKYGHYWRAKANVAIDTAMEMGLAVPHYLKLIEIAEQDTTDDVNRKRLIESYGYLASYKANHEKDYTGSMEYFEKILSLQPDNEDAKKYMAILKKYVDEGANKIN
ncbi:tetratricopeptide repeat protein [soil metagenome]